MHRLYHITGMPSAAELLIEKLEDEYDWVPIIAPATAKEWPLERIRAFFGEDPDEEHRQTFERCLGRQPTADIEVVELPAGAQLKVYGISDVHVDATANALWLQSRLPERTVDSFLVVLVAGDVSDDLERVEALFVTLQRVFHLVCFTPGNHDLWVRASGSASNSVQKLHQVLSLCDRLAVRTGPCRLRGDMEGDTVLLAPLFSWYHDSWDCEPDLPYSAVGLAMPGLTSTILSGQTRLRGYPSEEQGRRRRPHLPPCLPASTSPGCSSWRSKGELRTLL